MSQVLGLLAVHWPQIVAAWHWFMVNVAPWLVASAIPAVVTGLSKCPSPKTSIAIHFLQSLLRFFSWAEHQDLPGTFRLPVLGDLWNVLRWLATTPGPKDPNGKPPLSAVAFLPLVYLAALSVAGCATPGTYRTVQGVADAARLTKGGFRAWNRSHERAIGCPTTPQCKSWRAKLPAIFAADAGVAVALQSALKFAEDHPRGNPSGFLADVFNALARFNQAVAQARGGAR